MVRVLLFSWRGIRLTSPPLLVPVPALRKGRVWSCWVWASDSHCAPCPQSSHGNTMKQFMDIFSLPEMGLLSCVNEYFLKNNIDYEPVHLYKDVKVVWAGGGPGFPPLALFHGTSRILRLLRRLGA